MNRSSTGMRVALAGNPNSGKSTLFNALTGARARVGNYPGVTVERREARTQLSCGSLVTWVDLPGCYSLTARSAEEEISHQVLTGAWGEDPPDAVVCVVDATQLARSLYLVVQLQEMGVPVVVALNMMDMARAHGIRIHTTQLQRRLGVPVVPMSARSRQGIPALVDTLKNIRPQPAPGLLKLPLSSLEHQAIEALQEKSPAPLHPGCCLWLLTSDMEQLRLPLSPGLREAVAHQKKRLQAHREAPLSRRLIAARYQRIDTLLKDVLDMPPHACHLRTRAWDRLLLHPRWGLVIFAALMFVLFQAVFVGAQPLMDGIKDSLEALATFGTQWIPTGHTQSLFVHGMLAGIGNILAFTPQIALLFAGLAILEESGYMARAAFLLDPLMRRVGLHGKAFIPLLSSFACAIPGIMAARTIESSRDRLITMLIAPFMSCSARLPVYSLVTAAVFSSMPPWGGLISIGGLVFFAMYALGFGVAMATAWLLKRTVLPSPPSALLLELPVYRLPTPQAVLRRVYDRCKVFVCQTGSLILALSVLLWGLLTFPHIPLPAAQRDPYIAEMASLSPSSPAYAAALGQLERHERAFRLEHSWGGRLGHALEPVIAPLGFDWRIGIGLVASFAAREVLVSTLGQVYALDADVDADSPSLQAALQADRDPHTGKPRFTPLVGISLLVFFVLALQCLSTFATLKRETNSWRWPICQLVYMNGMAYLASLGVYQGGRALGLG